jgi:hypothetical protein
MSKAAAVYYAIMAQLAQEEKAARTLNQTLGAIAALAPFQPVVAAYDERTVRPFLARVALRLRADTPPLLFKWTAIDAATAVTDPLWMLVDAIATESTYLTNEPSPKSES